MIINYKQTQPRSNVKQRRKLDLILYMGLFCGIYGVQYGSAAYDDQRQLTLKVMKEQMAQLLRRFSELRNIIRSKETESRRNSTHLVSPSQQPGFQVYRDCKEIYETGYKQSGVHTIQIFHGFYSIPIFCDMDTVGAFSGKKGWMTIQRRINGKVNFDRGWRDYLYGFGFPDKEHWIGLQNILSLTRKERIKKYDYGNPVLRIDLEDWDGNTAYMEHDSFSLLSEKFDFEIEGLGRYNGTPGLGGPMEFSASSPFSTFDHNNDHFRDESCVKSQKGGWWFGYCNHINLNGVYSSQTETMTKEYAYVRNWRAVNPRFTALRFISIKLQ